MLTKQKYPHSFLRPKGAIPLAMVGAGLVLYFSFFFDDQLQSQLETFATQMNHAQVSFRKIDTHLTRCALDLHGLEIPSSQDLNTNVLEVDEVKIQFLCGPLFRSKMVISDMTVTGVRLYTPRKYPANTPAAGESNAFTSLIERVASGFYGQVREQMGENPLRTVGSLVTGIDLSSRVDDSLKKLASQQKLSSISQKLKNYQAAWFKEAQGLPSPKVLQETHARIQGFSQSRKLAQANPNDPALSELRQIREEISNHGKTVQVFHDRVYRDLGGVSAEIAQVEGHLSDDIAFLRTKLKLPRLDKPDLTPALFGPLLLGQLERLSYWIDLSRRKMPKAPSGTRQLFSTREGRFGTVVHFDRPGAYPDFLLQQGKIQSTAVANTSFGTVSGQFAWLTTNPSSVGKPFTFVLTGNFPSAQILGLQISGTIDHTKAIFQEHLKFAVEKLPLGKVALNDAGDAIVAVDKTNMSLTTESLFKENEIKSSLEAEFKDSAFSVHSRFTGIQNALLDILSSQQRFTLFARMEGPFETPYFETSSSVGKALATGMQKQFSHQILAIDDDLRKNLLDRIHPLRTDSVRQILEIKDRIITPIALQIKTLQELTRYADESIERLEGKKIKAPVNTSRKAS